MILRTLTLSGFALALTACASIEGTYLPSCLAYTGSEIQLTNGRFHWSRFTDQVVVDEDGDEVDQFPGFPVEGNYEASGKVLTLFPDSGEAPHVFHVQKDGNDVFLLSAAEKATLETTGERPSCVLQRQVNGTR